MRVDKEAALYSALISGFIGVLLGIFIVTMTFDCPKDQSVIVEEVKNG